MKLKGTQSVEVDFTAAGTIVLEQFCEDMGEFVFIYITLDQFRRIQKWVIDGEVEINSAWNDGVDDA